MSYFDTDEPCDSCGKPMNDLVAMAACLRAWPRKLKWENGMATEKRIIVDVAKDGSVKIEADGYKDNTCLKATEDLEKSLGIVTNRTKKAEALRVPVGAGGVTVGKK